jgi:hypothetical protein
MTHKFHKPDKGFSRAGIIFEIYNKLGEDFYNLLELYT